MTTPGKTKIHLWFPKVPVLSHMLRWDPHIAKQSIKKQFFNDFTVPRDSKRAPNRAPKRPPMHPKTRLGP